MTIFKRSLGVMVGFSFVWSSAVIANTKDDGQPKSVAELWKIIQAQQVQLEQLTKKLEAKESKPVAHKMQELDRKTNALAGAVEKIRTQLFIPDEVEYKSQYGLGPAASKIYKVDKGLSIGGYGEAHYTKYVDDDSGKVDDADFVRLVAYIGYKFSDSILFNSEIEFEHATTGKDGSVSVEFAALDFFIDPMVNVRAGMVLMPMGFINPIHEPTFFFGNNRPEVEKRIIPSTWRENGVGFFGELLPGLTYTTYVVNGMNAKEFSSSGIRSGRQSASKAKADDLAFVGRMDYAPAQLPGVSFGASAYLGNSGQNQVFNGQQVDVFTQLYEGHVQVKYRGLEFRALGSWGHINNADMLSADKGETIGRENYGWYVEAGYDVMPHLFPDSTQYLAPFFRYERLDTIASAPTGFADDLSQDKEIFQIGINYKPIPNVVIKADYRNFDSEGGDLPDDFNLGVGFIF
jgi:hypothetical protein